MNRALAGITIGFVMASVVMAQTTVAGKWRGETRNGAQIVLDLTVTKTAVTGTLTRNEETAPITDGKVEKNTVTFKATLGEQTESLTAEVANDEMTIWLDRQGRENAIVLKRGKS